MSESFARFGFLPWTRRGLARFIATEDDGQIDGAAREVLPVKLKINDADWIEKNITLIGPGDVVGLEASQIIRREPERDSRSFIPNYFPSVEFRTPDLPWLFTPLKPNTANHLRPWLCLVVVRQQPGVKLTSPTSGSVSRLEITGPAVPADELPDLDDSWAWAHTQVTRLASETQTAQEILDQHPARAVSRLLSPRRLAPKTSYYACVVPCFKASVNAALDLPPINDLAPAWLPDDPSVTLPVYDSWEFTTGVSGDFEALVRLLKPQPVPEGVGKRDLDLSEPRWGSASLFGVPDDPEHPPITQFEGALRAPGQTRLPLPADVVDDYPSRLEDILNAAQPGDDEEDPDPIVAPPLYGRWHAGIGGVREGPQWVPELNLDPRERGVAGLGTLVVRNNQEALMHSAWEQVENVVQANNLVARAKLAEAVGVAFMDKHFASMSPDEIIEITSGLHSQLLMSPVTLEEKIRTSSLPDRTASPALRRLKRRGGTLARAAGAREPINALSEMAAGTVIAAAQHLNHHGLLTHTKVANRVISNRALRWLLEIAVPRRWFWLVVGAGLALFALASGVLPSGLQLVMSTLGLGAAALGAIGMAFRSRHALYKAVDGGLVLAPEFSEQPPPQNFSLKFTRAEHAKRESAGPVVPEHAREFRDAAFQYQATLRRNELLAPQPLPPELKVEEIRETLLLRLDPREISKGRFGGRIVTQPPESPDEPLEQVMRYPEFDTPMYEGLRKISSDLVLPGLQHVATNSITLVETNRRFIEAYMVGLNHEMSRELRWREYPTDQRGSYFRQFWDPRSRMPPATDQATVDARRDIKPIHNWDDNAKLGTAGLPEGGEAQKIVLLIRGELLRRFPTAQIYAQAAKFEADGLRTLGTTIQHPLFRGSLQPDVFFLGFDFDRNTAIGSVDEENNTPGWFFVIQQQPGEPRFGLDVATEFVGELPPLEAWNDVSWGHFAIDADALAQIGYLRSDMEVDTLTNAPQGLSWGQDASALAFTTLQKPVRIAIHADDMLPGE